MSKTAKIIFGVVLVVIVALALYFLINSLVGPQEVDFSVLVANVEKYITEHGNAEGLAIVTSGLTSTVYITAWQRITHMLRTLTTRRTSIG